MTDEARLKTLKFLGTSAGTPTVERNTQSIAVELTTGEHWLFDCGEGTLKRIKEMKIKKLTKIFITHLHNDHVYGLPSLLLNQLSQTGGKLNEIIGPLGLSYWLTQRLGEEKMNRLRHTVTFTELNHIVGERLDMYAITERNEGFMDKRLWVDSLWLDHRIPSLAYRIVEPEQGQKLDTESLILAGVPKGPQWGNVQKAAEQTNDDQEPISIRVDGACSPAKNFLLPAEKGQSIVISGDTVWTEELEQYVKGANYAVLEGTYMTKDIELATEHKHSLLEESAGDLPARAGVDHVFITHFSPRYKQEELNKAFRILTEDYDHRITFAKDYMEVTL